MMLPHSRRVLAEEGVQAERHGLELRLGEEGEREQVLGPAQQEGVGRGRDDARQHDREDDPPDHLEARAAVDDRRLVELARHRFQIADQQIDRERDA